MYKKKSIEDIQVNGKKVLLRCDFNVPLKKGQITDDSRLRGALPTITRLLDKGAKLIICSHLGKPGGKPVPELSLAPVADRLTRLLEKKVFFAADSRVTGKKTRQAAADLRQGEILLLENLRYRPEETGNAPLFAKELADLAEIFVNDAFGTAHRCHASTVGVTQFMKINVIGCLIRKELHYLGGALNNPARPFTAILGGAKISDKINVIANFLEKVDTLIIGGGMTYTFLKALGYDTGNSLLEKDKIPFAFEMLNRAKEKNVRLLLPIDHLCATSFSAEAEPVPTENEKIGQGLMGMDIGPKSISLFQEELQKAKTVVWNGPMGVFEFEQFSKGTLGVAETLADLDATTIVGGGDSAAAVNLLGYAHKMSHISTGGGASLQFMEGRALPGIEACDDREGNNPESMTDSAITEINGTNNC